MKMYAVESIIIRISIILGMVAAVVTILYFSPLPEQYFKSCDRPCHDLDYPMICRMKISLESLQPIASSCGECLQNATACDYKKCVESDIQTYPTARPQLPSIQVCQNDVLIVDVENRMPGKAVAIHWRGQPQTESPFMDGVPMVTQCPVPSYTTFQYRFRASEPGTHLWQAHSHLDVDDGIFGALVVRQSDKIDPHKNLYDVDAKSHVILISEWSSTISTSSTNSRNDEDNNNQDQVRFMFINGKSIHSGSLEAFKVRRGKRYRFRAAYAGSSNNCPITISVEAHLIKIISVDGHPINPYEASSVTFSKGERVDFVLKARRPAKSYYVRVKSECGDESTPVVEGLAVIEYEEEGTDAEEMKDPRSVVVAQRNFNTARCDGALGHICIEDVRSLKKLPKELRRDVDKTVYLSYDYEYFYTGTDSTAVQKKLFKMNNVTFTYPPSPLLTQLDDVPVDILCSENLLENCKNKSICECVHIVEISLKSTVELILHDQGGDSKENIFHLHGNSFYVVGIKDFNRSVKMDVLRSLNEDDMLFKRNLINPAIKDTIRIPRFGAAGLRFVANNPGYWLLRDEKSLQWTRGMEVILKVGDERDFKLPPSTFPTCGSWRGPDFFFT